MARSRKRIPIAGIGCSSSDKPGKRVANRRFRRLAKEKLRETGNTELLLREISNVWTFPKDGKCYYSNVEVQVRVLRK